MRVLPTDTMQWPFFADEHRALATSLRTWTAANVKNEDAHSDVDAECRSLVRSLGDGGWLKYVVPKAYGGTHDTLDVRSLCIARETLAHASGLADFSFAMQGLGSGPITQYGSPALAQRYLPRVAAGEAIAAFALSEAEAGSDVVAMRTRATRDGDHYRIDGEKTWISNGGIADFYVVFCRVDDAEREFIALVVEPADAGFSVSSRIATMAPHPLATIRFDDCRVPADRVVGEPGRALRVALGTLDVFRTTVGAAALGLARRALDEALAYTSQRQLFGQPLAELQLSQAKIARMATDIDASALLIYRSAWTHDVARAPRVTREAAMAKMYATEAAQRVIDDAVQLHGGRGVVAGSPTERLYRDIRALRIYEGATEVQQLVIARQVLDAYAQADE
jgi:alkylation response protein AidB-like acyl-CoA dehydrogenase